MTKKHFIALADAIKDHRDKRPTYAIPFTLDQLDTLARFCQQQNAQFNRERWLGYIVGENGPNGGAVKR